VGRIADVFSDGERCGKVVDVPASDVLTIEFAFGRRKVDLAKVRFVYWYGKPRTVAAFLAICAERGETVA
jgi:hypothetical protein